MHGHFHFGSRLSEREPPYLNRGLSTHVREPEHFDHDEAMEGAPRARANMRTMGNFF